MNTRKAEFTPFFLCRKNVISSGVYLAKAKRHDIVFKKYEDVS